MLASPTTASICFENASAVILEEEEGRYVQVAWQSRKWELSAAQTVMNELLGCLQSTGWHKVIIKQPPLRSFPLAYHTWLLYDWLPRAQVLGAVSYALIPPRDLSAHVGFADFLSQLCRFKIHYFVANSREQAVAWLNAQSTD